MDHMFNDRDVLPRDYTVVLHVGHFDGENNNLCDDPPFSIHFLNIYNYIFHFGKFQEYFNSRSKMAHLPLNTLLHCTQPFVLLQFWTLNSNLSLCSTEEEKY